MLAEAAPLRGLVAGDHVRTGPGLIVPMARMARARRRLNRERAATIPRSPGGLGVVDCEDRDLVLDRRGVAVRVG